MKKLLAYAFALFLFTTPLEAAPVGATPLVHKAIPATAGKVAPEKAASAKKVSYTGYMVDKMCSGSIMSDASSAYDKASKHDKACLIEPPCLASGYGIVTPDNRWIPFDKSGDQKAAKVAHATAKQDHIAVRATGQVRNGKFYLASIAEQ